MNEQLQKDLQRYRRRHLIEKEMDRGTQSQNQIKAAVRNEETESKAAYEQLIAEMQENEVILYPESAQIATELQKHLQEKFSEYTIAIILIGSAVTGGQRIRQLFSDTFTPSEDDEHIPDFDFILQINHTDRNLEDEDIDQSVFEKIDQSASEFLSSKNTRICKHLRPSNFAIKPLTQSYDIRDQNELITKSQEALESDYNIYLFYFEPSYPPEANERNKKIFLNFLTKLYKDDPDEWNSIVSDLVDGWREIHILKPKYFSKKAIGKDIYFHLNSERFTQLRLEVFKRILKTTTDDTGALYIDYM